MKTWKHEDTKNIHNSRDNWPIFPKYLPPFQLILILKSSQVRWHFAPCFTFSNYPTFQLRSNSSNILHANFLFQTYFSMQSYIHFCTPGEKGIANEVILMQFWYLMKFLWNSVLTLHQFAMHCQCQSSLSSRALLLGTHRSYARTQDLSFTRRWR